MAEASHLLPKPPSPAGNYVLFHRVGDWLYLSGCLPLAEGRLTHEGKIGITLSVEQGYQAARQCALNVLALAQEAVGSLQLIKQIISLTGFVNAVEGFADSPSVLNGASDCFLEILGERGRHTRAAVAVAGLPKNAAVEIQCILLVG